MGEETCSVCGYSFNESESKIACPNCKNTARTKHLFIEGTVTATTELEIFSRSSNFPLKWWIVNLIKRIKIGRVTGFWAKEELRFDRSAPEKTVKTHHVEELQPDGNWKVVHDEREEFPAKKRPWLK